MSEGQEPERTKEEIERRKVCIEAAAMSDTSSKNLVQTAEMIYEYVYGARKRA